MKLNWGSGIAIFYISFAIIMVVMVMYSKTLDNSLVVDDYYDKDLQYQTHIDKLSNTSKLAKDLELTLDATKQTLTLEFPKDFTSVTGTVWFYRADDKSKDVTSGIEVNSENIMGFDLTRFTPGKWTVKIDWQGDGTPFYKEQTFLF